MPFSHINRRPVGQGIHPPETHAPGIEFSKVKSNLKGGANPSEGRQKWKWQGASPTGKISQK